MSDEEPKSNRPKKVFNEKYLNRIDNLDEKLASEKGKYMKRCQEIKADKAAVYDEYDVKGGAVKAMKHFIKVRNDVRKNIVNVDNKIGDVMGEEFRFLADQLGLFKPVVEEMGPTEKAEMLSMMALAGDLGLVQSAVDGMAPEVKDKLIAMLGATRGEDTAAEDASEETVDEDPVHVEEETVVDPSAEETVDETAEPEAVDETSEEPEAEPEPAAEEEPAAEVETDPAPEVEDEEELIEEDPDGFTDHTDAEPEAEAEAPSGEEE